MENLIVFMGQSELSDKLGVLYTTIGDWIKMGLPCYQVGKDVFFHEDDVVAFLRDKRVIKQAKEFMPVKRHYKRKPKTVPSAVAKT